MSPGIAQAGEVVPLGAAATLLLFDEPVLLVDNVLWSPAVFEPREWNHVVTIPGEDNRLRLVVHLLALIAASAARKHHATKDVCPSFLTFSQVLSVTVEQMAAAIFSRSIEVDGQKLRILRYSLLLELLDELLQLLAKRDDVCLDPPDECFVARDPLAVEWHPRIVVAQVDPGALCDPEVALALRSVPASLSSRWPSPEASRAASFLISARPSSPTIASGLHPAPLFSSKMNPTLIGVRPVMTE